MHWRHPDGSVAWLTVRAPGPSQATAAERGLDIRWPAAGRDGPAVIRIRAPGVSVAALEGERFALPGLTLVLETDAVRGPTQLVDDGAIVTLLRPEPGSACTIRIKGVAR